MAPIDTFCGEVAGARSLADAARGTDTRSGIYAMWMPADEKQRVYIGQTHCARRRFNAHRSELVRGTHHTSKLQRAFNKYGAAAFMFALVEVVEHADDLTRAEQQWIDSVGTVRAFNTAPAAESQRGIKRSDAVRAANADAARLRQSAPEARARLAEQARTQMNAPGAREANAERVRQQWASPEARKMLSARGKRDAAALVERTQAMNASTEYQEKMAALRLNPAFLAAASEATAARHAAARTTVIERHAARQNALGTTLQERNKSRTYLEQWAPERLEVRREGGYVEAR